MDSRLRGHDGKGAGMTEKDAGEEKDAGITGRNAGRRGGVLEALGDHIRNEETRMTTVLGSTERFLGRD